MDNNDDTPLLPQLGPSAIEIPENPRRRERNWKINIYLVLVSLFVFLGAIVGISLLLLGHNRNHIPKLTILISLDGTRPEYLTRKLTPRLSSLSEGGIYSEMIPEFPSITFPNHYTIVTGLHPESHGIVGNTFRDFNQTFLYVDKDRNKESKWWLAEPIWITAVKHGIRSATCFWPGSEAPFNGLHPTFFKYYNESVTLSEKIQWVFEWIDLPVLKRPSLISLYIPDIDHSGHLAGPDSDLVNSTLSDVDYHIGLLLDGIEERHIKEETSIIIVSDHGMTKTSIEKVVFLDDFVPLNDYTFLENGPIFYIYPKQDDYLERIYNLFKEGSERSGHFTAYMRDRMPSELHYQSSRVAPIVLVADMGWFFATREHFDPQRPPFPIGAHGYDSNDPLMHAIFIANGKRFKPNSKPKTFHNSQVYQVIADTIGVAPLPNNGTKEWFDEFTLNYMTNRK